MTCEFYEAEEEIYFILQQKVLALFGFFALNEQTEAIRSVATLQ